MGREGTHRGAPGPLTRKAGEEEPVGLGERRWPKVTQLWAPGQYYPDRAREGREGDTNCHIGQEG